MTDGNHINGRNESLSIWKEKASHNQVSPQEEIAWRDVQFGLASHRILVHHHCVYDDANIESPSKLWVDERED